MTITQATFTYGMLSKLSMSGFDKEAAAKCTMIDILRKEWFCEFSHMSLKQIADFTLEFFNAHSIESNQLKFVFNDTEIVVRVDSTHTSARYLEIISSQINIG